MAKKKAQHEDATEDDPKCIRYRDRNYRNHKSPGYVASGRYCQVHHILPCTSVSDATIGTQLDNEEQYELIQNCFQITNWDINAADNCLGLPLKKAFHFKVAPSGWNGWPCHQVDHPAYNVEVSNDLTENVWQMVAEAAEECEFDATSLEGLLKGRSKVWLGNLKKRGSRLKGGQYHWDHRAQLKDTWFVPFSMSDPPQPRSAPKNLSDALQKHLEKLYKVIGK